LSKVQVDTIDTRSGTSTMQIGSTNTSTINLGVSGDTVNIPSGVTIANAGTATGFGGTNDALFYAYCNDGNAAFNNATDTTVVLNAELFDSDSKFNTSNYRFTPGVAGKYFLYGQVRMNTNQAATLFGTSINKNGVTIASARFSVENQGSGQVTAIVDSNTTDYFTLEAYQNTGFNHNFNANSATTYFTGFKLIT
jgi:hypothetical protein